MQDTVTRDFGENESSDAPEGEERRGKRMRYANAKGFSWRAGAFAASSSVGSRARDDPDAEAGPNQVIAVNLIARGSLFSIFVERRNVYWWYLINS